MWTNIYQFTRGRPHWQIVYIYLFFNLAYLPFLFYWLPTSKFQIYSIFRIFAKVSCIYWPYEHLLVLFSPRHFIAFCSIFSYVQYIRASFNIRGNIFCSLLKYGTHQCRCCNWYDCMICIKLRLSQLAAVSRIKRLEPQ